jgi:hypothetical protein
MHRRVLDGDPDSAEPGRAEAPFILMQAEGAMSVADGGIDLVQPPGCGGKSLQCGSDFAELDSRLEVFARRRPIAGP